MDNMKALHNLYFSGDIAENWKKWKKRWNLYVLVSGAVEKDKSMQCVILLNAKNLLTSTIHLFSQDKVNKYSPLFKILISILPQRIVYFVSYLHTKWTLI